MCALFGWLDCGHKLSSKTLRKLTQGLANASESRGKDASGIAYNADGKLHIYKKPKAAHKLRFCIPQDCHAVMGHTRMATQGDEKLNYNNHPFYGKASDGSFALAHNGVLYNDLELRREKNLPETVIETDSYIAVQLMNDKKLNYENLRDMAEAVRGSFTFTILDERDQIWFVKGSSPMYILFLPELSFYVYGSTKEIVRFGIKCAGLHQYMQVEIEIKEGELLRVDPTGHIDRSVFTPHEEKLSFHRYFEYEGENEYLLDYFSSFGYPREEIELLLDFGYSVLEVEEMLMDPQEFRAAVSDIRCCLEGEYGDEYENLYAW